jgi:hypothetical protein
LRRVFLITCVVLFAGALSAPAALADQPEHIVKQTFTGTYSASAGQLCDFDYYQTWTVVDTGVTFADGSYVIYETEYVTHTNLDTGYTLSEVDHVVFNFDASDAQFMQVGLYWHLRDASGKLVVVHAGQALFNTDTGELLKFTPNVGPDFAAVICPALGGQPAT